MSNIKCVVNPTSGNGVGKKLLQQKAIPVQATEPDNIKQQLLNFLAPDDTLIIAGGDGTVHLVINALAETKLYKTVTIVLYPLGTGNDLGKALNLPKRSFEQLICHIQNSAQVRQLAIWSIGQSYFTNYISWGIDAKSLDEVSRWRQRFPKFRWLTLVLYAFAGIKNLFFIKRQAFIVNKQKYNLLSLVLTSIASYGGGSKVSNHNITDTPCLNCVAVKTRWQLISLMLTRLTRRAYPSLPFSPPVTITNQADFVQADGEMLSNTIQHIDFFAHIRILT
jgi:diacylglycerol kinase family enzyme